MRGSKSPIEPLCAVLKKLAHRTTTKSIEELKGVLLVAWGLIPEAIIDELCEGFKARLELYLAKGGGSVSNDLWQFPERGAMKTFLEDT
jgi:hypothetical protein